MARTAIRRALVDLGSGTGALTAQILRDCAPKSVTGVEPSEGFLKLARGQVTDGRATFIQGAGDRIPSGDGMSLDEASRDALKTRLQKTLPTDEDGMILLAARAWAVKGRRA